MKIDRFARMFFAVFLGLASVVGVLDFAAAQATPQPSTESIEITGAVANPGPVTLADIQALPSQTVEVDYRTDDGTDVHHSYTGARLWDVMQLVQPAIDPRVPESSLYLYLVLTAKDGYVVVLSMGEIDPEFGAQPYLLAWDQDGAMLTGDKSPLVLVTPSDRTEGRYIHGIVSIEVGDVTVQRGA